jgi:hypothetical protein
MRLFVDHPEVEEVSKHAARLREGNNGNNPSFSGVRLERSSTSLLKDD